MSEESVDNDTVMIPIMTSHTYIWAMEDFNKEGVDINKRIVSPKFSAGGDKDEYEWSLVLHPNGFDDGCEGYLSVSVHYASKEFENLECLQLQCKLSILDADNVVRNSQYAAVGLLGDAGGYMSFSIILNK